MQLLHESNFNASQGGRIAKEEEKEKRERGLKNLRLQFSFIGHFGATVNL